METIGTESGNPAAFGWDWTEPGSGTEYELVNPVGTRTLRLGVRPSNSRQWATLTITAPERFLTEPPKTRKAWRAVVDRWFGSAEEWT